MRVATALISTGAFALVGCRSILGIDTATAPDDAGIADGPDGFAGVCYGTAFEPICFDAAPEGDFVVVGVVNTSTCVEEIVMPLGNATACVVAAETIEIDSVVGVVGPHALVLLAADRLSIGAAGVLDVSSRRNAGDGPGANPTGCSVDVAGGDAPADGCGGGAGGSFGGSGGPGGASVSPGGTPALTVATTSLVGGCPGGRGGTAGAAAGEGGPGGGAVYLLASTLAIEGVVNASGAAGEGGNPSGGGGGGGGGGGSGGLIVLEATSLVIGSNARVFANGGGGGAGAGQGSAGSAGSESSGPTVPGSGGAATSSGGSGGDGATDGDGRAGAAAIGPSGGGGGGGGTGRIRMLPASTMVPIGTMSPPPT